MSFTPLYFPEKSKIPVLTRTFFDLGGSRFSVTPGVYAMAFLFLSVLKQSLLCLVVIFSPMLVSCRSLLVSSAVASHCFELQSISLCNLSRWKVAAVL